MIQTKIFISSRAERQVAKVPDFIKEKLYQWVERVEEFGILEIRKIKGFHDEPLIGKRTGQRSIRLNKSYRAIYSQNVEDEFIIIDVLEVNKHEY